MVIAAEQLALTNSEPSEPILDPDPRIASAHVKEPPHSAIAPVSDASVVVDAAVVHDISIVLFRPESTVLSREEGRPFYAIQDEGKPALKVGLSPFMLEPNAYLQSCKQAAPGKKLSHANYIRARDDFTKRWNDNLDNPLQRRNMLNTRCVPRKTQMPIDKSRITVASGVVGTSMHLSHVSNSIKR